MVRHCTGQARVLEGLAGGTGWGQSAENLDPG